jgi:hypothetical protein
MNANSWPAFHLRALRTALGIEIWNFDESVAVSDIVIPLFDRSGIRKKLPRAEPFEEVLCAEPMRPAAGRR